MIEFSQGPVIWQTAGAIIIFAAAYLFILVEVWNRTYTVIAGAVLMLLLGIVPIHIVFTSYISWDTLFLIAGLYIISNFFRKYGLFQYAAIHLIRRTYTKPLSMLLALSLVAAVGSALFDSILLMIALVPFTVNAARILKVSSIPFVIAEIFSANLGGTATLIGNFPNRMIGSSAGLSFTRFIVVLGPLIVILTAVAFAVLGWIYRRHLVVAESRKKELLSLEASGYLLDRNLLYRGSAVMVLMLISFLLQEVIGVKTGILALIGALLILILDYKEVMNVMKRKDLHQLRNGIIDSQLLFFLGLFIMVGGLTYSGVSGYAAARWIEITQGSLPFTAMLLLWLSGIGSAAVDSVPFVAAMLPVVKETGSMLGLADLRMMEPLWWALVLGAGIGGGGSLVGSSVNIIAAGLAEEEGEKLTHWDYFKIAGPLTLLMLVLASLYLSVFFL